MSMKISLRSLRCTTMILLVYHIAIMRFPYISNTNMLKYMLIMILGVMIIPYIKILFEKNGRTIKLLAIVYFVLVLCSAFINRNMHVITHTLIGALVFVVSIIEIYVAFAYVIKNKGIQYLLKMLFVLTLIYVILNDILLIVSPTMFYTSTSSYYLVGNKFAVAYRHMELVGLLVCQEYFLKKRNKYKRCVLTFLFVVLALWAANTVQGGRSGSSVTGILVILLILVYNWLPTGVWSRPTNFVVFLFGSIAFAFGVEFLLSFQNVQNLIINVLKRDISLTGRVEIYAFIPKVLSNHLLWGYGYGSSYETWMSVTHIFPNSQNGLLDCIVEQGLLATGTLILLLINIVKDSGIVLKKHPYIKGIMVIIYVYLTMACIEITISLVFIMWFIFIFAIETLANNTEELYDRKKQ